MKYSMIFSTVLLMPLYCLSQTDLQVDGNVQLNRRRSTIFFQGDYVNGHRGGIQFLTHDNGSTFVFQPTDYAGTMVNSTLRLGGFGAFSTNTVNLNVSGNVGIGTTNPGSYKLAVEGKIGAREVVVTTAAWADYVFEPSYNLRPLSEVETFLKENKHLPEIPSAKEVEANGVNLGEMNILLLKKVEELTLYVIELKKENERQQEQIKVLERQK